MEDIDARITIEQRDKMREICKKMGYTRTSIMRKIMSEHADKLPDVNLTQQSDDMYSELISNVSPKAKAKISQYCKSVKIPMSVEVRRAVSNFILENQHWLDRPE